MLRCVSWFRTGKRVGWTPPPPHKTVRCIQIQIEIQSQQSCTVHSLPPRTSAARASSACPRPLPPAASRASGPQCRTAPCRPLVLPPGTNSPHKSAASRLERNSFQRVKRYETRNFIFLSELIVIACYPLAEFRRIARSEFSR